MPNKISVKTQSISVRDMKTSLDDITIPMYDSLSQDEIESLFYHGGRVIVDMKELEDIWQLDHIQKLLYSDGLSGLNFTERKVLLGHIIIDVTMKARENKLSDFIPMRNGKQRPHKVYIVDILDAIDSVITDGVAIRLLQKLAAHHGHKDSVNKNNQMIEQIALQLIGAMEQNSKQTKLWKMTKKKYDVTTTSLDLTTKFIRLEVYSEITEATIKAGHFNNYPLIPKEPLKQHMIGENKHKHMLKNGLQQNESALEVLNTIENNIWSVSKYIHQDTYRGLLNGQLLDEGKDVNEAEYQSHIRTKFIQTRIRLGKDRPLFIPARYDSRGRMYLKTYQLNPQGSKYEKQMLVPHKDNFKDCRLTKDNYKTIHDNICIGIADILEHDKLPFYERVMIGREYYLNENENNIYAVDYPILAHYREMLDEMEKNVYPATMVSFDATNQGLQLYSVLTGSKAVGEICNTASGDVRADAYGLLANELNNLLSTKIFDRDNCKKGLMITMYGSSKGIYEIATCIYKRKNSDEALDKLSKQLNIEVDKLKELFQQALLNIAPDAMKLMQHILDAHQLLNKAEYTWTLPDGFKSRYRTRGDDEYEISFYPKRKGFKDKEVFNRERFKVYKQDKFSRGLPANIVQSIDGYVMREMVRRMNGRFITCIHDAFYCHPEHMELLKQNYKDILSDILQSNLVGDIMSQILGHEFGYSKVDTLSIQDIQQSEFILS